MHFCEQENVKVSLDNLISFPGIRERVQEGVLKLDGLCFYIPSGSLYRYRPQTDSFEMVQPPDYSES